MVSQLETCPLPPDGLSEKALQESLSALTPDDIDLETFARWTSVLRDRLTIPLAWDANAMEWHSCDGFAGQQRFDTGSAVVLVLVAGGVKATLFTGKVPSALEQLGLRFEGSPAVLEKLLTKTGLMVLTAASFYPALKPFFEDWRKDEAEKGIFNYMLPFLNPANPRLRVIHVNHPRMLPLMADYLARYTHTRRAFVTRGNRCCTVSQEGKTHVYEVTGVTIRQRVIRRTFPERLGADPENLTSQEDSARFQRMICGEDQVSGEFWDVCLNAGAGFYLANKAETISDGVMLARSLLLKKNVLTTVERCRKVMAKMGAS